MKKILSIAGIGIGLVLLLFVVVMAMRLTNSPAVLLFKLRHNIGNKTDIYLHLGTARKDIVPILINSLREKDAKPTFRVEILQILLKKNRTNPEDRIFFPSIFFPS